MAEQILKWFLKKATAMGCETEKGTGCCKMQAYGYKAGAFS